MASPAAPTASASRNSRRVTVIAPYSLSVVFCRMCYRYSPEVPTFRQMGDGSGRCNREHPDGNCKDGCIAIPTRALTLLGSKPGHGPRFVGVQDVVEVKGAGGEGGMAQGTALKSKNSSGLGCAVSRGVKWAELPRNRFSTNLIIAVWSIGVC